MAFFMKLFKKYRELIMYGIFGMLTTLLNIALYMTFSMFMHDIAANTLAFFLGVIFAYWTNSCYVFRKKMEIKSFLKFLIMRIGTLLIDDGGMWLLLSLDCNKLLSKCIVNVVVIILNYIFSKFFIFVSRKNKDKEREKL